MADDVLDARSFTSCATTAASSAREHGLRSIDIRVKGPGSGRESAIRALQAAGVVPRIATEIGSREALREAVVRGIGLGAVSEAEFIADPRIRAIRLEGDPLYTETYLYCLAERRSSRLISSFFEVLLAGQSQAS